MLSSSAYGRFLLEENHIILLCASVLGVKLILVQQVLVWLTHEVAVVVVGDALLVGGGVGVVGIPQLGPRLGFLLRRLMVLGIELRSLFSSLYW